MHDDFSSDLENSCARVCDDFRDCPEIFSSIAELFRETYPFDFRDLRAACEARDSRKVAFLAHKIRGSILVFHQDGAARAATELEERAVRGELVGTDALVELLGNAFISTCSTVEKVERKFGLEFDDGQVDVI
jgi:hypothetical protein